MRDNETAEERKARQRKVQEQIKINRDNETAEERKARQKKDKEQKKFEKDNETTEERKTRQNNNQMQKKVAREKETDIETKERKQKDKNHKRILNKSRTELGRLNRFKETVRYGPIYTCCVCEQDMFKNSVTNLTEKFESDIRNKSPMLCENALKNKHRHLVNIHRIKDGKREPESELYFICTTCKKHLSKGNLPPMAAANGLELMTLDDKDLQLSELESNLIAKTLIFQKIYLLPKSRMSACKDQLINIPVSSDDVLNTLEHLPRTPGEAGLLEVKLKRKMEYKNTHQQAYVDPNKIYKALEFLKRSGHPEYKFYDDYDAYRRRCQRTQMKPIFVDDADVESVVDKNQYVAKLRECPEITDNE